MFTDSFFRAIIEMPSIIRLPASRGVDQVRKERNRSNPGGRRRNRDYQILPDHLRQDVGLSDDSARSEYKRRRRSEAHSILFD